MILHFMKFSPPFKMFTLYKLSDIKLRRLIRPIWWEYTRFNIKINLLLPPKFSDLWLLNKLVSKIHILRIPLTYVTPKCGRCLYATMFSIEMHHSIRWKINVEWTLSFDCYQLKIFNTLIPALQTYKYLKSTLCHRQDTGSVFHLSCRWGYAYIIRKLFVIVLLHPNIVLLIHKINAKKIFCFTLQIKIV